MGRNKDDDILCMTEFEEEAMRKLYDEDMDDFCDDDEGSGLSEVFGLIFGGILKKTKEEPKIHVGKTIDKANIATHARNITIDPGVQEVTAPPATGKTTVFPTLVATAHDAKAVVVVPDHIVLASVIAQNAEKRWVDEEARVHNEKFIGPLYMSMQTFLNFQVQHGGLQDNTFLFFDEVQQGGIYRALVDLFARDYGHKLKVIKLFGHTRNTNFKLPEKIKVKPVTAEVTQKRVMRLYSDNLSMSKAKLSPGDLKLLGTDTEAIIRVFRHCADSDQYTLHMLASEAVGVDLPNLEAVVAPDKVELSGRYYNISAQMHVQLALRAARRGGRGFYYTGNGTIPDDKTELAVTPVESRRAQSQYDRVIEGIERYHERMKATANRRPRFFQFGKKPDKPAVKRPPIAQVEKPAIRVENAMVTKEPAKKTDLMVRQTGVAVSQMNNAIVGLSKQVPGDEQDVRPVTVEIFERMLTIPELARLPEVTNASDVLYSFESLYNYIVSKNDVTTYLLSTYNAIVSGAKKHVAQKTASFGGLDYRQRDPAFYQIYQRLYRWFASNDPLHLNVSLLEYIQDPYDKKSSKLKAYHLIFGYDASFGRSA